MYKLTREVIMEQCGVTPANAERRLRLVREGKMTERQALANKNSVWTPKMLEDLMDLYPKGGYRAMKNKYPELSKTAIVSTANRYGIITERSKQYMSKISFHQEFDDAVKSAFISGKNGEIAKVVERFNVTRHIVRQRAIDLGCSIVKLNSKRWTPEEDEILLENCDKSRKHISRLLSRKGYTRSDAAVGNRLFELKHTNCIKDYGGLSATSLAYYFGVSESVIRGWISKKFLKAPMKDGQYCIKLKDLREFMINKPRFIDHRKIKSMEWIVEVLTGKANYLDNTRVMPNE